MGAHRIKTKMTRAIGVFVSFGVTQIAYGRWLLTVLSAYFVSRWKKKFNMDNKLSVNA